MNQHDGPAAHRSPLRGLIAGLVVLVLFSETAREHISTTICVIVAAIVGAIGTFIVLTSARRPR